MITDEVLFLATDVHGAVLASSQPLEEGAAEISIGGTIPLGIPADLDALPEFVGEILQRLGLSETTAEALGTIEDQGKTYHVFYVASNRSMVGRGPEVSTDLHFLHRWFIESNLDYMSPLSARSWELIRNRPFDFKEYGRASIVPADVLRREGQYRALTRLLRYAHIHAQEGIVVRVCDERAELIDADGNAVDALKPANLDTIRMGLHQVPA